MKRVMVRYRVKAERVEENERYIGKVGSYRFFDAPGGQP